MDHKKPLKRPGNLPLDLILELQNPKAVLIIKTGKGKTLKCRQKKGTPLVLGQEVLTVAGTDGHCAVMRVEKRTKKDIIFKIMGRVNAESL